MESPENQPFDAEWAPAAEEPIPVVMPSLPGPNIGMALVWWLLFFGVQLFLGIGLALLLMITVLATQKPGAKEEKVQARMQEALENEGFVNIVIVTAVCGNLAMALGITVLLFRSHWRRVLSFRWVSPMHVFLIVLMVLPLQMVALEAASWAAPLVRELERIIGHKLDFNQEIIGELASRSWIFIFLTGCLLPGLGEEIFFRGFLSRGLVARHGLVVGTILASALFGAMHISPLQVVATTVLGVGFQIAFLSSKSLWGPIILHTLNNALAFFTSRLGDLDLHLKAKVDQLENAAHLPLHLSVTALALVVTLCVLFYQTRVRWFLPDGQEWSPGFIATEMPYPSLNARPRWDWPSGWAIGLTIVTLAAFGVAMAWEFSGAGGLPLK
jgi:membrane protease YdiL (CAAX protease family)